MSKINVWVPVVVGLLLLPCAVFAGAKISEQNGATQQIKLQQQLKKAETQNGKIKRENIILKANQQDTTTKNLKDVAQTDINKDIQNQSESFIKKMYSSEDDNLMSRYKGMKKYLTGHALDQLKPKSSAKNTDTGRNSATVSGVTSYVSPTNDPTVVRVLTEYNLVSHVDSSDIKSAMILKTSMKQLNGSWLVSEFGVNTAFASNLSNRK